MNFLPEHIDQYAVNHSERAGITCRIIQRNLAKALVPRMISGHFQGRFLAMISKLVKPKNILEIGTYTGYSALCLAEGMGENGFFIPSTITKNCMIFKKIF